MLFKRTPYDAISSTDVPGNTPHEPPELDAVNSDAYVV